MKNNPTIRAYIEKQFLGGENIKSDDQELFTSGIIDSFGVLELISFLESTYNIVIDTQLHELKEFDSVNLISSLIEKLKNP